MLSLNSWLVCDVTCFCKIQMIHSLYSINYVWNTVWISFVVSSPLLDLFRLSPQTIQYNWIWGLSNVCVLVYCLQFSHPLLNLKIKIFFIKLLYFCSSWLAMFCCFDLSYMQTQTLLLIEYLYCKICHFRKCYSLFFWYKIMTLQLANSYKV